MPRVDDVILRPTGPTYSCVASKQHAGGRLVSQSEPSEYAGLAVGYKGASRAA